MESHLNRYLFVVFRAQNFANMKHVSWVKLLNSPAVDSLLTTSIKHERGSKFWKNILKWKIDIKLNESFHAAHTFNQVDEKLANKLLKIKFLFIFDWVEETIYFLLFIDDMAAHATMNESWKHIFRIFKITFDPFARLILGYIRGSVEETLSP